MTKYKNPVLISIACLMLLGTTSCSRTGSGGSAPEDSEQKKIISEARTGDYVFQYWTEQTDEGETLGGFQILQSGKPVYIKKERQPSTLGDCGCVSTNDDHDSSLQQPLLMDLTGQGVPDLLVRCNTGGAHNQSSYYIFALGKSLQMIGYVEAGDSDLRVLPVKGSNVPGLVFNDWSFASLNIAYADSPAPEVALRWKDGAFRVAPELMKDPPPASNQFEEKIKEVRSEFRSGQYSSSRDTRSENVVPPAMWEYMLDLIYSGNGEHAWKFFDLVWPADVEGKRDFLRDFKRQMAQSKYWPDIKALNNWS